MILYQVNIDVPSPGPLPAAGVPAEGRLEGAFSPVSGTENRCIYLQQKFQV